MKTEIRRSNMDAKKAISPISPHLADYLTPLSQATAELLKADPFIKSYDRLRVSIYTAFGEDQRRFLLEPFSSVKDEPGTLFKNASAHASFRWWQRVPGASVSTQQRAGCTAPITDITVLCILAVWGKDKIEFEDEVSRLEFWAMFGNFIKNQKVTEYQAHFKENKTIPEHAPTGPKNRPFMPHQRVAALCLHESTSLALWMEMRTGKSGAFIGAMDLGCVENPHCMNLIVCPKNVRTNWVNEIQAFTTKKVHIVVVRGTKIERIKMLLTAFEYRNDYDYTVVLTSYEGLVGTLAQICAFSWYWCCTDEGHFFKSANTRRWQAVKKLRDCCEKRTELTGTPICNTAFDLFTQFEWLYEGGSGFSSQESFRRFYGTWEVGGHGFERLVGMQNLPLLQERITRQSFMISKREALPDLPPETHTILEAEMTPYQQQVYTQLATVLFAEIDRDLSVAEQPGTVTINNVLTKLLRLAQVTAGFIALDGEVDIETGERVGEPQIDRIDPNPKLEVLIEHIKSLDKESKAIVCACFIPSIKQIKARLDLEGIKAVTFYGKTKDAARDQANWAFNHDPETKVVVMNPAAGGIGTSWSGRCPVPLSDGREFNRTQCDTIYYYCQGWSQPVRTQSSVRSQDKNCTWSVEIVDICCINSGVLDIDFEILNRVLDKQKHAMEIQDVREMLRKLVK